ncbi:SOS cell division inhibitor SulA [Salinisphaera orenii MK-B5]|uniref:SOS cell division inhibitor SulA n=1 Tax=Salinisphaera orenii MK-B5 TaxID=856730 RepID=A0A423PKX4_9GAMM|nr:translesion DNA synthesis-associated protein ImuA [Salinisphaera orenii]ROO26182.1 SOS cell division inhibitor SulA [Salinisphaera orenii MK-B5]
MRSARPIKTQRRHSLPGDASQWQRLGLRRASQQARQSIVGSGWSALDRLLPGGGYPAHAVTEFLVETAGTGEFSLLLTCLGQRLSAHPDSRIGLVAPPRPLNAPALAAQGLDIRRLPLIAGGDDGECVWAIEQMAHSGGFAGFVFWSDGLTNTALRKLQLAAENAACPIFVYRDLACVGQRSPAALRLAITRGDRGQRIEVRKCRGPAGARLDGLQPGRDRPWIFMPESSPATRGFETHAEACNDDGTVARPAFPPLAPR